MNCKLSKHGFTLVELLVVVAILVILLAGLVFVSNEVRKHAQRQLVESTLAVLDTALQQYYDNATNPAGLKDYPPDLNYSNPATLGTPDIQAALGNAPPVLSVSLPFIPPPPPAGYVADYIPAQSVEVLYYYLNRVPQSRQALSKLSDSLISGKAVKLDASNKPFASKTSDPFVMVTFTIGAATNNIGLARIIDPWNTPLRYSRPRDPANLSLETTNFPKIESAGPDKTFGTADDIVNK